MASAIHAVPFLLRRSHDVVSGPEVTTTVEDSHGLMHLDGGHLKIQWSTTREVTRVGRQIRSDRDLSPVHDVTLLVASLAGATVQSRWFPWPKHRMRLRAANLRAFGVLAEAGLVLEHPAELVVRLRRSDVDAAREFASELELALSEVALNAAEENRALPPASGENA